MLKRVFLSLLIPVLTLVVCSIAVSFAKMPAMAGAGIWLVSIVVAAIVFIVTGKSEN